jgi:predicted nucleotidyltransferase
LIICRRILPSAGLRFSARLLEIGQLKKSDIDILVEFAGRATFDNYMNLKFHLQDVLHTGVDLVTRKALRPQIKEQIEKELIDVKR